MCKILRLILALWLLLPCAGVVNGGALVGPEFGMDRPVPVAIGFGTRETPAIAFNGEAYLAIWIVSADQEYHSIVGTRISKDGAVLDLGGIAISPGETYVSVRAVASNGTDFLAVWDYGYSLYGARIRGDGTVQDRPSIPISQSGVWEGVLDAKLSSNGSDYFVVSSRKSQGAQVAVYGTRVSAAGEVLDPNGIFIRAGESAFAVASLGTNYLVAWHDFSGSGRIVGKRISGAGVVLDTTPIFLSQSIAASDPSIATGEGEYFVVWQAEYIRANRISGNGELLLANDLDVIQGLGARPYVVANDHGYLIIGQSGGEENESVYAARVNQNGVALDTNAFPISTAPPQAKNAAVASDGHDFFVVWERWPSEWHSLIFGTKVDYDTGVAETNEVLVSGAVNGQSHPAVAANGTNYLVVWSDSRGEYAVYGARVSLNGETLDTNGIRISPPDFGSRPSVASCAGNYLVVWQSTQLAGRRVSGSGEVLDTNAILISTSPKWKLYPQVAANGSNYLVVWENRTDPDVYTVGDIYGALLAPDGQVLKTDIRICTASGLQTRPAVAASGGQYLVVWEDPRGGLYRARVSGDGEVLDPDGIVTESSILSQYVPQLCAIPGGYLVVWYHYPGDEFLHVRAVRVSADGDVLSPAVTLDTDRGLEPAVASDGDRSLVVWEAGNKKTFGAAVKTGGEVESSEPFPINPYIYFYSRVAAGENGSFLVVSHSAASGRIVGNMVWLIEQPTVQIVKSMNGEIVLSWPTETGRTYQVQFKADLSAPDWTDLPGELAGTGGVMSKTDTSIGDASQRFYRISAGVSSR